jgi:hypothetical protein
VTDFPALDAALGLAFLYFLLSTVCSAANEGLANVLGWRAKTLEDAVRNMLGDPQIKKGWKEWLGRLDKRGPKEPVGEGPIPADLTSAVFDHWRISSLVRNSSSSIRRRARPSYLPPRALSLAVAEVVAEGAPERPRDVSPWQQADEEILAQAQAVLATLPDGQVRSVLEKSAANANGTLEGFRRQVERAFDDSMERASGWYKRKVQVVLLVLAAVVAIGLNVDSGRIASRLWNEGPVRAAVATKAKSAGQPQDAADAIDQVQQLKLPLGWGEANAPDDLGDALWRVPGWLITIAALSLGAPFWFDLLSRVARLRGSGVPERPRSLSDTAGTGAAAR